MERLTEQRHDPRDTSFTERHEIHYTVKKEKKFKAFDKLGEMESLLEQIGCPLEVDAELLKYDTLIFDQDGVKWFVDAILKDNYITTMRVEMGEKKAEFLYKQFKLSDYKKTWWLKADRSE